MIKNIEFEEEDISAMNAWRGKQDPIPPFKRAAITVIRLQLQGYYGKQELERLNAATVEKAKKGKVTNRL